MPHESAVSGQADVRIQSADGGKRRFIGKLSAKLTDGIGSPTAPDDGD
jgi:hypothetical protein